MVGMTVADLEDQMTNKEFVEWLAYIGIKNRKVEKIDLYLSRLSFMYATAHGVKNAKIEDYLFSEMEVDEEEQRKAKNRELMMKMKVWASQVNAHYAKEGK